MPIQISVQNGVIGQCQLRHLCSAGAERQQSANECPELGRVKKPQDDVRLVLRGWELDVMLPILLYPAASKSGAWSG